MPTFETKRRVPYSAREMYSVVADVAHYPAFLPMCTGLVIKSRAPVPGGEELIANMSVGFKAVRESFTTRVMLSPEIPRVDVSYLDGPFSHLENRWCFIDLPQGGSLVDFYITYQFRSAALGLLAGAVFEQAFRKFAGAFEERARTVYGPPKVAGSEPVKA